MNTHTIAMWSGPRNLSTAMMRAWENRSDTSVSDEPFYAYFLAKTERPDPLAKEIIAAGLTDWEAVVAQLCTPPNSKGGHTGLHYHKHITTHLLPEVDLNWLTQTPGMSHVFLIREPARVVASFDRLMKESNVEGQADNIGFHQQLRMFNHIHDTLGKSPLVIDSTRFLQNPESQLKQLCTALGIDFQPAMLAWPAGSRDSDGLWATHWYTSVKKSTNFGPPPAGLPTLNDSQQQVAMRCEQAYQTLLAHAI